MSLKPVSLSSKRSLNSLSGDFPEDRLSTVWCQTVSRNETGRPASAERSTKMVLLRLGVLRTALDLKV